MATFNDISTIAASQTFQNRCFYALMVAATQVMTEVNTTNGHINRSVFATKVLNGQVSPLANALAVLTNPTIAAEATVTSTGDNNVPDADIQFAVNSLWNSLSGLYS